MILAFTLLLLVPLVLALFVHLAFRNPRHHKPMRAIHYDRSHTEARSNCCQQQEEEYQARLRGDRYD